MRIEHLEYVAAVTRHGSVRRASEQLHVSQATMSEAISRLERELGVRLLERHRSGARLSAEGQALLGHLTNTLESAERLRRAVGQHVALPRVRVGTVSAGTSTLLVPATRRLGRGELRITAEVHQLQVEQIRTRLVEGLIDVGLINQFSDHDTAPQLESIPLVVGRPVAVVPASHPLAQRSEVTLDDLRPEPFVRMHAGYLMHRYVERLFDGAPPEHGHDSDGAELGKMMVAQRVGVTVLTDYSVVGDPLETSGLIRAVPLAGEHPTVTLTIQRARSARVTPAMKVLLGALQAQAALVRSRLDELRPAPAER